MSSRGDANPRKAAEGVRSRAVPSGLRAGELRQQEIVRAVSLGRDGELHSPISTSNKSIYNMGIPVLTNPEHHY